MSKTKIYMGIPSTGTRSDAQVYAMREIERLYGDKVEFHYPPNLIARIFHDFARNEIVKEFLASDCDILWFLDSDVVPPAKVMDLVTEHGDKWDLAGAPYPVFMSVEKGLGPVVVYTVYKKGETGGFHASAIPDAGTDFVDGIATGCLFIKRKVLEQMQAPYFEFKYNPESREMTEGEDLGFCRKANELGFKFFTDYSMVCKHYKNVDLLEVNNYAVRHANNAIAAYDRSIRSVIAKTRLQAVPTKTKSKIYLP